MSFAFLVLLTTLAGTGQSAPSDHLLADWDFSHPAMTSRWRANAQMEGVEVTPEGLKFRCTGSDPVLEYTGSLNIAAGPDQAIEFRLKADHDGDVELFWSGTTTGRYGGFSGDKRTPVAIRGDGKWHTYRVYPFWQAEQRIVRLRFDPYDATTFTLSRLSVVEPLHLGPYTTLPPGWSLIAGVAAATTEGGVRLAIEEPGGFALGRRVDEEADRSPIVSLRAVSSGARRAALVYVTDSSYGLHEMALTLIPDGRPHTYNVDMLDAPEWRGRVLAVGLRPGRKTGESCVVRSLDVSDRPTGAADLRVLSFGIDHAMPRQGAAVIVTARITNGGGIPARDVKARLDLSPGAALVGPPPKPVHELVWGQEAELRWRVRFAKASTSLLHLRIDSPSAAPTSATAQAAITAAPRIAVPMPPPKPVRGNYEVGAYYFPGWHSWSQWAPVARFPERKPVLGWYREGDPTVADWQIRWAVEHGITFFAYDWYWTRGARQLEHALLDGYLHAKYRRLMKFCLLWANHNPEGTSSRDDCLAVTRYWIDRYFRDPEYLRINGRPVVIIFSPYRLRADMRSSSVRQAFDAMRDECRRMGVPPVYLIACVGDAGEGRLAREEGYDAVTAYNWPALGVAGGETDAPYSSLIDAYARRWHHLAEPGALPLLTPLSGGWDSPPWHGESALVRSGRTPALFRKHLQDALRFIQSHSKTVLPMALVEAWNEWGEGSYIEPHQEYGFGYLDAIRDVFAPGRPPHQDVAPGDVRATVPQVAPVERTTTSWRFARETSGWDAGMNMTTPRVAGGVLFARTTGDDPAFFGPPMQAVAARFRTVVVRLRLRSDAGTFTGTAQLFWSANRQATSEAASAKVRVTADGNWHEYTFDVGANPRWRGIITQLRLDPCSRSEVTVDVESIALR